MTTTQKDSALRTAADRARKAAPPTSDLGRFFRATDFPENHDQAVNALHAIQELRARLLDVEKHAVLAARRHGATWQQIADATGTSRQNVHQLWSSMTGLP